MTLKWGAAVGSGVAAGIVSTLAQAALWLLMTDRFAATLFRDARLTAAMIMGRHVLPPPATFDLPVMLVATLIHFSLSVAYGLALALLVTWRRYRRVAWIGAGFGVALYLVNLYGFTHLYPWFARVRDADTLMAHIVFGVTGACVYRWLARRSVTPEPPAG